MGWDNPAVFAGKPRGHFQYTPGYFTTKPHWVFSRPNIFIIHWFINILIHPYFIVQTGSLLEIRRALLRPEKSVLWAFEETLLGAEKSSSQTHTTRRSFSVNAERLARRHPSFGYTLSSSPGATSICCVSWQSVLIFKWIKKYTDYFYVTFIRIAPHVRLHSRGNI